MTTAMTETSSASRRARVLAGSLLFAALLLSAACKKGPVDTTKSYYEDSEAPEFQVQVWNGVETKVRWAEVPEINRYFTKYDKSDGEKLIERVPIVKVTTVSLDRANKPLPPGVKPYHYQSTQEGLNPTFTMCSLGGEAH